MNFDDFQKFIDEEDALFTSTGYGGRGTRELYARTIKLGEEYGELCDEILASAGEQRKGKLSDSHNIEGEFADVVITTFLLAKIARVDIPQALAHKIKIIKSKHNKQIKRSWQKGKKR